MVNRILVAALLLALGACRRADDIQRLEWPVMGTIAAVQWRNSELGADAAIEGRKIAGKVRKIFAEVERLLNRHDPNSEICSLAGYSDGEVLRRASSPARPCYEAAFRMRDATHGAFDPRWRGTNTLDLGAIAKGFAVDLAAAAIDKPCLIDLGGNLKAVGSEWRSAIAFSGECLVLKPGMAVATSAEYFRGRHIYDARSRQAVPGGVSVSVIHPHSAMMADALSTALFILGRDRGEEFLKANHPSATAVWLEVPPSSPTETPPPFRHP